MKVYVAASKDRALFLAFEKTSGLIVDCNNQPVSVEDITLLPVAEISDDLMGRNGVHLPTILVFVVCQQSATIARLEENMKDLLEANQQQQQQIVAVEQRLAKAMGFH